MPIGFAVDSIALDELATILLPIPLIVAIDEVDIECVLWKRRRHVNANIQDGALLATSRANERILPVVVFGETVIPPLPPVVVSGNTVMPPRSSIHNQFVGIRLGGSYRAIQAALEGDHEVLVVFVSEPEIANYKTGEPQQLPTVGVIARLEEVVAQPDGTLQIVLDVTTRAIVTARLQHDPFYRAACAPHSDPEVTSAEVPALMAAVKAQAMTIAPTLPYLTPEQVEELHTFMSHIERPGQLADFVNYSPTFAFADKLAILNTLDPLERLRLVQRTLGA